VISGAGTGGATKAIFREIGDNFLSYTYTDISAGFFETASSAFSQHKDKMTFKTLNVENDTVQQGYTEGAYDLVVAFFVIHATSDLECSLRNLRRLLKPGGFLVIGEGADNGNGTATSGFIFGTLPGWWIGTDKGRVLTPLISPQEWNGLLLSTGFSGTDATLSISADDVFNVFPVVSQAVDDRIHFLREPLSTSSSLERTEVPQIQKLILVGGKSSCSAQLMEDLQEAIIRYKFAVEIHRFESLTEVDFDLVDDESTVVSLTDLDAPVFRDITEARFDALKRMFDVGKKVLWITSGRRGDEPFANMMVAFARCAAHETPELRLQQVDISDPGNMSSGTLAEILMRFHAALLMRSHENTSKERDIFWTIEPEMIIDHKKRQLAPRLCFIDELNERYNAGRRHVTREIDIRISPNPVRLQPHYSQQSGSGYVLREVTLYETELWEHNNGHEGWVELDITHATLSALKTPFGHMFLILGVQQETGVSYLALVSSLSSPIRVFLRHAVVGSMIGNLAPEDTLRAVAAHLVSLTVLDSLHIGQTLVVYQAPSIIADALTMQAAFKGVEIVYTTHSTDESAPETWVKLPEYLSQSELNDILALEEPPSAFLGFSNDKITRSANETTLLSVFGARCNIVMTAKSLFSPTATGGNDSIPPQFLLGGIEDALCKAVSFAQNQWPIDDGTQKPRPLSSLSVMGPAVPIAHLIRGSSGARDLMCIVNWTQIPSSLPVLATRLDAGPMFKGTRCTYWLVGMSGALGISLTDWMISRGARNLVITSRTPEIDPEWISSHKRHGAIVRIMACDVTDERALGAVYREICNTLPPVMGVIHGAMVLRDVAISNMSFEQLNDVVGPKVNGSIYLDRIFSDINLDFFVLTSSVNTVIGNRGQANYAAANAFMCSLAAQRRKRGLRAAAVNGGAILGAGYMERDSRRTWDRIAQNNWMMRMSEDDFVQSICEGIEASRLDSSHGPEITTGLNFVPSNADSAPFWASDPKFSVFIIHKQDGVDNGIQSKATTADMAVPIQSLLLECKSQEEVHRVVQRKSQTWIKHPS
jgi:NAD(P)-dependent dehydrogenase (short-subunit alcohol dehydrogenase family)